MDANLQNCLVNDMFIWKNLRNFSVECYILQVEHLILLNKTKDKVQFK